MTEIHVLGPIEAVVDGEKVDLGGPTQRRLLATLVARRDEVVPTTDMLGALWGEDPPPSGPASIQSYVSRLRKVLGPESIVTTPPGYRLGTDIDVDSDEFLSLSGATNLDEVDRALGLWSGPPYEDFEHLDFASRQLVETRFGLEERRARLLSADGRLSEAVASLERITSNEPLRESAWTTLASILVDADRQTDAIRALNRYRDEITQVGLDPSPAFVEMEETVFSYDPGRVDIPLPRPATTFIGRTGEKHQLAGLLGRHRLVSVVGPGGMGKTRLALEAASDPAIEGRRWLVRFDAVRAGSPVAPKVLSILSGESRGNPTESIIEVLRRAPGLLIFDNCEHVVDQVAELAGHIVDETTSRVLTTSREPLRVTAEHILPLGPMDGRSAVTLYRERALGANPSFEADEAEIETLCAKLDNMPLAIEMAASRSRALSPKEIIDLLSRRYGVLDSGLRGGADRHQTLDNLVDWSYTRLDRTSQLLFERLSVFVGPFSLDAAIEVAGFGELHPDDIPSHVADLVDRSLIERSSTMGGYRMLSVLKSFARQKLEVSGDRRDVRDRHADSYSALAGRIGGGLAGPDEAAWLETANRTVEDLGAALQWSVDESEFKAAAMILEGLFDWLYHRQPPAIIEWGDLVLGAGRSHEAASIASAWAALAAAKSGDLAGAADLAASGTASETEVSRFAWFVKGDIACYSGNVDLALDSFAKQRISAGASGDAIGVVDAIAGEALALAYEGAYDRALAVVQGMRQPSENMGSPTYMALTDWAVGECLMDTDPVEASRSLERAIDRARSVNNQYIEGMALTALGSAWALRGDLGRAETTLHEALEVWQRLGSHAHQWTTLRYVAVVAAETGSPDLAVKLMAAAQAANREPFGSEAAHWAGVKERLATEPDYTEWREAGKTLDLEEATALATG